ncbi:hypothetical protein BVRB_5g116890 isoform A [Beta vulgaris subsp. vulgaris]|nr:hypothetical protein BVRB_5g116890 isoform A [Beta vulgaris subsp. vulgaris]
MKRKSDIPSSSKRLEKSIAQKSWRNRITELCSDLTSIIPPQHFQSKNMVSQADQIEQATNYIVELRERVDNLNKSKEQLKLLVNQEETSINQQNAILNDATVANPRFPIVEVKDLGSSLAVQLVIEQGYDIKLHEIIRVLEDEGAEVVNATYSTSGNNIIHTLHAKARSSRVGVEASRVYERLHDLV